MIKQECILLFPEVETVTKRMSDEQFGILIRAVIAYRLRGELYTGDDIVVDIAFQFLSNQQDRAEEARAAKSKAAKEKWAKKMEKEPVQDDAEPVQPCVDLMQKPAQPMQNDADLMQKSAQPMQSDADLMQKSAQPMQSDADPVHKGAEPMQNDAPILSNPIRSHPIQSNPVQSNPIVSNPIFSKERVAAEPPTPAKRERKVYGKFGWVRLSGEEYACLEREMGQAELNRCIAYLDESAQATGNKNRWRDWFLVLRKCHNQGWGRRASGGYGKQPVPKGASGELGQAELEAIQRVLREG